jgi:acyl carrier protein
VRTLQDVVNALTALLQHAEEPAGQDEAALSRAA